MICMCLWVVLDLSSAEAESQTVPCRRLKASETVRLDWHRIPVSRASQLLSCWTGRNLIVHPKAAQITLESIGPNPVKKRDLWRTFQAALSSVGLYINRRSGYWIISQNQQESVTVLRVHTVRADVIAPLIRRVSGLDVSGDRSSNRLWVRGSRVEVRLARRWLARLDVQGHKVYLVAVRRRPAAQFVSLLNQIFDFQALHGVVVALSRTRQLLVRMPASRWPQVYAAIVRLDR